MIVYILLGVLARAEGKKYRPKSLWKRGGSSRDKTS